MASWLWYSSVPGMTVPGMAQPGNDGTGTTQPWLYIGHTPVSYLDYLDATTGHTLSPYPGNWYSMTVANSRAGLTVPPPDHCWLTPTNRFAPRIALRAPPPEPEPPPWITPEWPWPWPPPPPPKTTAGPPTAPQPPLAQVRADLEQARIAHGHYTSGGCTQCLTGSRERRGE